jgi:hypothetical protein
VPQGGEDAKEGRAVVWHVEKKINFSKVFFSALSFSQSKKGNTDVLSPSLCMPPAFL